MGILDDIENPGYLASILGDPYSGTMPPLKPPPPPQQAELGPPPFQDPRSNGVMMAGGGPGGIPLPPATLDNITPSPSKGWPTPPAPPIGSPDLANDPATMSSVLGGGGPGFSIPAGPPTPPAPPAPQGTPQAAPPPLPPPQDIRSLPVAQAKDGPGQLPITSAPATNLPPPTNLLPQQPSQSGMMPPNVQNKGWRGALERLGSPEVMAGLGKGLASVGQNYNKPGLAALAASAGANIEGTTEESYKQKKLNFDQQSTHFKDMILARRTDNEEAYKAAQAKFLDARVKALAEGGPGSKGWQATPWGKVIVADKAVQNWYDGQLKAKREEWKSDGTDKDTREKEKAVLDAQAEQRRGDLYRRMGMTPEAAGAIRSMGTKAPGPDGKFPPDAPPFDARNMTEDMFNTMVPVGAYYIDHNGKPMVRTKPPAEKKADAGVTEEDKLAMAG